MEYTPYTHGASYREGCLETRYRILQGRYVEKNPSSREGVATFVWQGGGRRLAEERPPDEDDVDASQISDGKAASGAVAEEGDVGVEVESGGWHTVSRRFPLTPLQYCPLTPELQRQSRGERCL